MKMHVMDQKRVDTYLQQVPGAGHTLRLHNIDPSHRSLTNAAALAGTTTDDVRAVMDSRLRRAARHAQTTSAPATAEPVGSVELVA
jgi:hypothetical protein